MLNHDFSSSPENPCFPLLEGGTYFVVDAVAVAVRMEGCWDVVGGFHVPSEYATLSFCRGGPGVGALILNHVGSL